MPTFLLAPLRVELLHLTTPMRAVNPAFDPTLLPRAVTGRDLNPDTAFLGDEISSPPFQNRNQVLPPGVHLHWQMPRELTRGQRDPTGGRKEGIHPRLPNRWLITRSIPGQRARWIVESDYLHSIDRTPPSDATAFPMLGPGWKMNGDPIFRYLGRTLPLDDWLANGNKGDYLDGLTLMGYGNPAFAAFAPNCRGLFTFHDREGWNVDFADYSVVGFYSNPAHEPSLPAIPAIASPLPPAVAEPPASQERPMEPRPRILCIGRTAFRQPSSPRDTGSPPPFLNGRGARTRRLARRRGKPEAPADEHRIALGNTATEALCAFLADSLKAGETGKAVIEDQLEAILMSADLEH